ncbi:phage major capsid protein [Lactiplantibacillus plantarum]|uniref:phage major capsid protein n=1 Tax=Lactiplantibacillus plantarum TaxID=1590 RepID=UPI001596A2C6|nr:phage major capsid protein [Lactiplantibacillus plantarum]
MIQSEKLIIKSSEIRAVEPTDDNDNPTGKQLEGYALIFNSPSKDLGKFIETINPQALQNTDLSQVLFLNDHNFNQPIAKVGSGLTLDVDGEGLHFIVDIDDSVSYEADLYNLIQKGVVTSMSFGFELPDDGSGEQWSEDTTTGVVTRLITNIQTLYEISAVSIPAYNASSVATRGYDSFINNKKQDNSKGEKRNMTEKTIIAPETQEDKNKKEIRNFEEYIKSHGEKRDLATTDVNGKAIVPQQLVTPLFTPAKGDYNLSQYVTVKKVTSSQGTYPVATNSNAILQTKAENAQVADADVNIKSVQFNTPERMGRVLVSNELLNDNSVDLASEVQDQLGDLVQNTTNKLIMDVVKTSTVKTVASLDDVKKAKNGLNPWLKNKIVILNTDSFSYLDTLKDSEGKYLIQPNVQDGFAGTLFGIPVIILDNTLLPTPSTGLPIIIGDLSEAVVLFEREQVSATYQQFDSWSTGVLAGVREDAEPINFDGNLVNMVLTTVTPAK